MPEHRDSFAVRLHVMRVEKGHTQGRAAEAMGVSRDTVKGWELGDHLPHELNYKAIADYMGLTFAEVEALITEERRIRAA